MSERIYTRSLGEGTRKRYYQRLPVNIFEKRNSILGMEFDRYIRLHPEFTDRIPDNAHIILLLEGDDEFNDWSSSIGKHQAEEGQPIVYVTIKKLGPVCSRIKKLEVGVR